MRLIIFVISLLVCVCPASAAELEELFYQGFSKFTAGSFGGAAQSFGQLREAADGAGFRNLPEFSQALLFNAQQKASIGEDSSAQFLLHWASALSPSDPGVQLALVSETGSLSAGLKGLFSLGSYPSQLMAIVLNCLLVSLVGSTTAWILVCILQTVRNGEELVFVLSRPFPLMYRGLAGPLVLLALLAVPLFAGILAALGVWCLVLSFALRKCRWFGAIAGFMILTWALLPPVYRHIALQATEPTSLRIEIANNQGYLPLKSIEKLHGEDDAARWVKGMHLAHQGAFGEARRIFEDLGSRPGNFGRSARLNTGVVFNQEKKFQEALNVLESVEQQGGKSFALYYNLAAAHLGLIDLEGHRKYYGLAKTVDADRLEALSEDANKVVVPVYQRIPETFLWRRLLSRGKARGSSAQTEELLRSLFILPGLVLWFGIGVFVLGIFARFTTLRRSRMVRDEKASAIWSVIPAGGLISGSHPILGGTILSLILSCFMAYFEKPIQIQSAFPLDMNLQGAFLAVALLLIVLTVFLSLGLEAKER